GYKMKIYLYLKNKILAFALPQKISGNFNFDEYANEEAKLINIAAIDGQWYIYSTNDVSILSNGMVLARTPLEKDKYYVVKRGNQEYILFATEAFDASFLPYRYTAQSTMVIGNDNSSSVRYSCPYIKGVAAKIRMSENYITVDTKEVPVYRNNIALPLKTDNNLLKSGDVINIYGLKIMFLNGFILINNPCGGMTCNTATCRLSSYDIPYGNVPQDREIRDTDLYSKDDYFSKAPRVKRMITTKEITLSPPPKQEKESEMPLILTVGPMLTMGVVSLVMFLNTLGKLSSGQATIAQVWPSLVSSLAMIASTLLWPTLTKIFNKTLKFRRKRELINKYSRYLNTKREELTKEQKLQSEILVENLIPTKECLNIIQGANARFWDKRIEQSDFLEVRLGTGKQKLDVKINYPEEGFTIDEDDLKKKADELIEEFKYLYDVPVGYSLYKNKITALMGDMEKCYHMISNIILQLITFYSYEDIKLVVITNPLNEGHWEYVRFLNHCFSNDKQMRFFSSTTEGSKRLCDYLYAELQNRIALTEDGPKLFKPYYIILTDDYSQIKRYTFAKTVTELDENLGFSLVILENRMSKLPSKCNNFITAGANTIDILTNSFTEQESLSIHDEIDTTIDMMAVARKLSNIPIEFEEGTKQLPESITFLEMERVGRVEQLNIMNRWDTNDSTTSLKAEIGVDSEGDLMYLDLHEKFHGPHGLIAGMTGSGKSEFIITYILSMAINYSPDDVAFILIDYKGGGLAGAFENKTTGIMLPHLAGTITNLDKAEMDRTLVSIDSEIKRRQKIFNKARDDLGESTIDIYKYQRFYKEGRLTEPIPHLFIICDEFAELKSQQPEFMDNLISVARIGRSLGIHLILATQKPSGVVNDQIWSNTKFRVCLKVQDASDSKEMLKRPEAASIRETGRFYLQVGYDEYFALGQSAWCGARYFPSEKIIKQVDKSINFIDDTGNIIKNVQSGNNIKIEAQGEQLSAIMNNIIEIAKLSNKKAKRLWLNDIDPLILVDALENKYDIKHTKYDVQATIGEYDAPEKQEQNCLVFNLAKDGNTVIYGNDETERESILNAMIYSICKSHSAKEINIYAIDYGSEQLRTFMSLPQIGGMVFLGDDEGLKNLFKLIMEEIKSRKKLFVNYGGSFENYNSKSENKLPQILFIINNYESLTEIYNTIYEDIASIGRDCERYGITLILTSNTPSTLGRRVSQCFNNKYALHLTDQSDYYGVFASKSKIKPRDILGRGLASTDGIHEFQTASIVMPEDNLNDFITELSARIKEMDTIVAKPIPALPKKVTFDHIKSAITNLQKVPIGISKDKLNIVKYDFLSYPATTIASNKLANIDSFMDSLLEIFLNFKDLTIFFFDPTSALPSAKNKTLENRKVNYFDKDFDELLDRFITIEENPEYKSYQKIYIFYGLEKIKAKVNTSKLEKLFNDVKSSDSSRIVIADSSKSLKTMDLDVWYSKIKNNTEGIWIGKGFAEQQNFRISKITKEMNENYANNYGFSITEANAELIKLIDFNDLQKEDEEDEQ
ncbi:MAG TPA: type VII secretion protein EssC, partial [Firmicutes bacterium]|nr:type VII secretion protein EssC [Bacillota bacterium]